MILTLKNLKLAKKRKIQTNIYNFTKNRIKFSQKQSKRNDQNNMQI